LSENLRFYIDYEAFSGDLFLDGHYSVRSSDFGVYVFASI
jgi:antirestriction protein